MLYRARAVFAAKTCGNHPGLYFHVRSSVWFSGISDATNVTCYFPSSPPFLTQMLPPPSHHALLPASFDVLTNLMAILDQKCTQQLHLWYCVYNSIHYKETLCMQLFSTVSSHLSSFQCMSVSVTVSTGSSIRHSKVRIFSNQTCHYSSQLRRHVFPDRSCHEHAVFGQTHLQNVCICSFSDPETHFVMHMMLF